MINPDKIIKGNNPVVNNNITKDKPSTCNAKLMLSCDIHGTFTSKFSPAWYAFKFNSVTPKAAILEIKAILGANLFPDK